MPRKPPLSSAFIDVLLSASVSFFPSVWYVIMDPVVGSFGATLVALVYLKSSQLVLAEAAVFGYPLWDVFGKKRAFWTMLKVTSAQWARRGS